MKIIFFTNAYTNTAVPYIQKLLEKSKGPEAVFLLNPATFSRVVKKIRRLGAGHVLSRAFAMLKTRVSGFAKTEQRKDGRYSSIEALRAEYGFALHKVSTLKSEGNLRRLRQLSPDIIFVSTLSEIIPPEILEIPKLGVINIHAGLLPKYRGPASNFWVLYNREKKTGITFHYMTQKPDEGDILEQRELEISPEDTEESLDRKLSRLGAEIICGLAEKMEKGTQQRTAQDNSRATYFPQPEYKKRRELKKRREQNKDV